MKKPFRAASKWVDGFKYLRNADIQTRRLILCPPHESNARAYLDFLEADNRAVMRFLRWDKILESPLDDKWARDHIRECRKTWGIQADLYVRKRGAQEIIGYVSAYRSKANEIFHNVYFSKGHRGKGYAQEALEALSRAIAHNEHNVEQLTEILRDNKASIRSAHSRGLTCFGTWHTHNYSYGSNERLLIFR